MADPTGQPDTITMLIRDSAATRKTGGFTLPSDLQDQAVSRVRVSAVLFSIAYFLAAWFPFLLSAEGRARLVSHPAYWLPGVLALIVAAGLIWFVSRPATTVPDKLSAAVAFEIIGSFGIAFTQYHDVLSPIVRGQIRGSDFGLSWVAPFVLMYCVLVPMRPKVALWSAVASVSSVPLAYATGMVTGSNVRLPAAEFFFSLIFPYCIVVFLAYFGARVVYGLGRAVRQAREMGSYQLVERLGEGGMGEVWRAEHRFLARPAAIKLVRPEMVGLKDADSRSVALKRFEQEAQATALLRSPHTVEVFDFGVTEDGTFYYVMELLDGFDLDGLVRRFGPVPAERAVHIIRQVCSSLGEAHEAGLIHRDIKPANLYLCRYGRDVDFVKVLDFGLVKRDRLAEAGRDSLTAGNAISGTPGYMAPEQALGDQHVDGRSDLYALGCVAYWLLTGTPPFVGATALETIVKHVKEEPDPLSRRTELPIPAALESLVMACLAKNPGERPQTADDLATRLAAVSLDSPWTDQRAREWWAAHRPN
jgi:eukaryotic-like serine/threonine-protein kinase